MLKFLFYFCVTTLSLGQFISLSKAAGLNIYIFDIVIGVFAFMGVNYFLYKRHLLISRPTILMYIFCTIGIISLIKPIYSMPFDQFFTSLFYLGRLLAYVTAGVVIHNMLKLKYISTIQVINAFIYSGLFVAIAGFAQLVLLPDFETLDPSLGWDPHKNRLASTFFDPNFTGGYLALCLTLLIHKFHIKKFSKSDVILFCILSIGLVLTFSRSAWGMMAIIILIYGVAKYRLLLLVAILIAFFAYFAVPRIQTKISNTTDPADSAAFRLVSWRNTWEIAQDNLLLGVGFNTFRYVQKEYGFFEIDNLGGNAGSGSDSSLLFILATTGIFGLGVFLIYLITVAKFNGLFGWAVLGGLLFQSQFINSLFFPQILFFYLICFYDPG